MGAEEHNQLYGPRLIVQVVDRLRELHPEQPTMWKLNKWLCDKHGVHGKADRGQVYDRVRTVIGNLEASGMVTTRNERDEEDRPHKYIALCSD